MLIAASWKDPLGNPYWLNEGDNMRLVSTEQMRRMDQTAVQKYGIPEEILMENAGESSYFALVREFGLNKGPTICLCGIGNNGGDGLVIARKLFSMKHDVEIYILGDPLKYKGPAKQNFEISKKMGIPIFQLDDLKAFEDRVKRSYLIVDAIFGTGLVRDVGGIYKEAIEIVNNHARNVLSIDIPSGINGDNGNVMGTAINADVTVTFGLPKYGNVLSPGFVNNGRLYLTHISFPPMLYEDDGEGVWINPTPELPKRLAYGHKGTFGDVLFIGGASSYYGAPVFSSLSFLKAGGGYARLLAPKSMVPFMSAKANEVVYLPVEETERGFISYKALSSILEMASKCHMVVIGPGLGISEDGRRLLFDLLKRVDLPVLIDGDGLTLLSQDMEMLKARKGPTILTPHPGEMQRISGRNIQEIGQDPISFLIDFSKAHQVYLVYKVARSIVVTPEGKVYINVTGNSGMATAGSGDVLTGCIASMYCHSKDVGFALMAGTFIHGLSGDMAALAKGEDGITANDIMESLPLALKALRKKELPFELTDRYQIPKLL